MEASPMNLPDGKGLFLPGNSVPAFPTFQALPKTQQYSIRGKAGTNQCTLVHCKKN